MDWDTKTVETYNNSADALAEYFTGIGARIKDIQLGLKLANTTKNARVVEIGCGDGRDAVEIVKRVGWYEGFDPSIKMLELAQRQLPDTSFVLADALSYTYPDGLDEVFAFASLLHVNQSSLKEVFIKVAHSLRPSGIFFISLKERNEYTEEIKKDRYGERMFYYYNVGIIKNIARNLFTSVFEDHQKIGKTQWFTIALKRP